jgi:hypothetical protein
MRMPAQSHGIKGGFAVNKTALILTLSVGLLLSACGSLAPAPPTPTATPDPCSAANLPAEATKVNNLMRQFDDYSSLAYGTPQSQLLQIIPQMQDVRRAAEDQAVPECLVDLKKLQLLHMQVTLDTLVAFQANRTNTAAVNAGIEQARNYHDQYTLELARLLNLTPVIPPTRTPAPPPPLEPSATLAPETSTQSVTNPGPNSINLHTSASVDSATVATLAVGQSAAVYGKSPDGAWYLIESPAQAGTAVWAYAPLVQVNGDAALLPVVTPSP